MKYGFIIVTIVTGLFCQSVSAKTVAQGSFLGIVEECDDQGESFHFLITGELRLSENGKLKKVEVKQFAVVVPSSVKLKTYVPREFDGKFQPFMKDLKYVEAQSLVIEAMGKANRVQIDVDQPVITSKQKEVTLKSGMIFDHTALYGKIGGQ